MLLSLLLICVSVLPVNARLRKRHLERALVFHKLWYFELQIFHQPTAWRGDYLLFPLCLYAKAICDILWEFCYLVESFNLYFLKV